MQMSTKPQPSCYRWIFSFVWRAWFTNSLLSYRYKLALLSRDFDFRLANAESWTANVRLNKSELLFQTNQQAIKNLRIRSTLVWGHQFGFFPLQLARSTCFMSSGVSKVSQGVGIVERGPMATVRGWMAKTQKKLKNDIESGCGWLY